MRILVSGVAGDIGFGVGRVLRDWGIFDRLFGVDISDDHPAGIVFDHTMVAPRADDHGYVKWLCDFIASNKIDLFIPTSEAEILVVSDNLDQIQRYSKVLINHRLIVSNGLDKRETLSFLGSHGVPVPANGVVGEDDAPSAYPIIVKPRRGQGSKGLAIIESQSAYESCSHGSVWQEYLQPEDQEYTCAVYVDRGLKIRTVLIKRVLVGGYTGKGVVVKDQAITDYVETIAKAFNKPGCYNIQLRLTPDGPRIFEINPRLSSTLVFRDKLGFTDLRWWVSELMNIDGSTYKDIAEGTRIYRGNTEYIVDPVDQSNQNIAG